MDLKLTMNRYRNIFLVIRLFQTRSMVKCMNIKKAIHSIEKKNRKPISLVPIKPNKIKI